MRHRLFEACIALLVLPGVAGAAATISECQQMLKQGDYVACLDAAAEAIARRSYGEEWPVLKATAETQLGRYLQASETLDAGIARYTWSIRLRMLRYDNCRIVGERERAEQLIDEVNQLATSAPWRYTDADDLVALGKAAIVIGADPKDVLEGFYDRARNNYKTRPDGYLAAGELTIEKGDYQLAAEILRPAAERFPDDPEICFALASAVKSADPIAAAALLDHTLEVNPAFLPTLLYLAERHIDAEEYRQAEAVIDEILETNPWHPQAHALMAVLHHLQNRPVEEAFSRSRALVYSDLNPEVDHVIGEKLSRKYRFREGAQYQRQALAIDPLYLPARRQLAQDLLRLGKDEEGWKLAEEARRQDQYDTMLFNLMQLRDSLDRFATLRTRHFIIRMQKTEADVYGTLVEQLLESAWEQLTEKYGFVPTEPVVVEIFDRSEDFAVRTFGVPDVAGFLGVCFGNLITANSPASQRRSPGNWKSVLWHEFCHVITLQMTSNRIPRWLSEGISVYEERQQDVRWGQSMNAAFRHRILNGQVTPVSDLSSAFLNAESGQDLNSAYFESSMVVEYIVQQYGHEALLSVLRDLNRGLTINDALDRHCGGIDALDAQFEDWLRSAAEKFAPGVKFQIPADDESPSSAELMQVAAEDPDNYTAGLFAASQLIRAGQLDQAEQKLLHLIQLFPSDGSRGSARRLLADVYRRREDFENEARVLAEHLSYTADDAEAAIRLLSLQANAGLYEQAVKTGEVVLSIDPLHPEALRSLYTAAEKTGRRETALRALQGLLHLAPADAARTHYEMARLLVEDNPAEARRHVLLALEIAPRYREAHRLLLQLTDDVRVTHEHQTDADSQTDRSDRDGQP